MYAEHRTGRDEGRKDRPCALVAAIQTGITGETLVLALPITHTAPAHASHGVELPAKVKQRLKLDDAPSWVIVSEWNQFVWPGPDLRRVPDAGDVSIAYGMLPPTLFRIIRDRFLDLARKREGHPVERT